MVDHIEEITIHEGQFADTSLNEIYHVPADVGLAYPITRKKRKLEGVQNFPEYERVMVSNGLDLQFGVRPDNVDLIGTGDGVEVVSASSKGILSRSRNKE
jgi:hypothetical protein